MNKKILKLKNCVQKINIKPKDFEKKSDLENKLIFIKNEIKNHGGQYSVMKDNINNKFYMVKEKIFNDYNSAYNEMFNIKNKINLEHPHILKLKDYSTKIKNNFCSKLYFFKLIYDYPENDLKEFSQEKYVNEIEFSEEELIHLVYQQIYAWAYLEYNNVSHGNIKPELIGLIPDEGISLLIIDENINKENSESVQKMNFTTNCNLYISEKLFYQIIYPENFFKYDKNKEDVFALGWIILETGLNKSIQNIYDKKRKLFNKDLLEEYINEFKNKFCINEETNLITSTIEYMLILDEESRPNFSDLKISLPYYEDIINYYDNLDEIPENNNNEESSNNFMKNENSFEITMDKEIKKNSKHNFKNYNKQNNIKNKYESNEKISDNNSENYYLEKIKKEILKPPKDDNFKYYKDDETGFYYYVNEKGESKWYEPNINFGNNFSFRNIEKNNINNNNKPKFDPKINEKINNIKEIVKKKIENYPNKNKEYEINYEFKYKNEYDTNNEYPYNFSKRNIEYNIKSNDNNNIQESINNITKKYNLENIPEGYIIYVKKNGEEELIKKSDLNHI